MGDFDWQLVGALLIVAATAVWLLRRGYRMFRGGAGSGCGTGGCGSCSAKSAPQENNGRELPLVTLEESPRQ